MSKKASRTAIGAFVVGAVALGIAAVLVFGSGKIFQKRVPYVLFFEGSIKGLQVGAPVVMQGVKVGEVTDISLLSDLATLEFYQPVYIEVDPRKFHVVGEKKSPMGLQTKKNYTMYDRLLVKKNYAFYDQLLEKGMKAQLVLQSFVTGQLWIDLDFHPDKPYRLVGVVTDVPEIPTIPSAFEELEKSIQELPLKLILGKVDNVLTGVDRFVKSPELQESVSSLNRAARDIGALARRLDAQVEPVASDFRKTLGEADKTLVSAREALEQAEKTLAFDEGIPGEVAASVLKTLSAATTALEESRKALVEVQGITSQSAYLGYEAGSTLEEMKSLSRSMRSLTDYLERHPESLIRGKSPDKGETR
jgi:paraquat-inducible protein B